MNFFVNISHELCTPLTLINGMTERISQMAGDNAELRKYADVMDTNVKGLNELVQEILDFRKIEEEGFGQVHIHSTDVAAMLSSQMKSFDDAARRNGIELQLMTPPELVWNTDRAFLKKIIFNLYSNAVKYTPENGIVSVSAHIEDDRLNIRIRNTGKGIPAEQMKHIFDRYKVLDDMDRNMYTDTASRHGLGLFICNALVKALEGEITVRSEVNAWTEFSVVLPFREEESADTDGKESVQPSLQRSFPIDANHESEMGSRKPLVMIVEDNKDITWLIADSLAGRYELLSYDSADAALSALDHVTPDLVITDIIMSGKSGLDLVREIRNDRYMQGVPVIVVSAKVSDRDQVEGFASGADAYLTKPFSIDELLARVRAMLRRKDNYRLNMFNIGDCILNRSTYELCYVKNKTLLSKKEFQIMEMLMERPKEIIPIDKIITRVWGWDTDVDMSVVWVHISNLRKKIELLGAPLKICFLRNAGYFLDVTVEEKS